MKKRTYVLDTSVFLTNANSVYAYGDNDIIVPMKVLEEIDKHKKRQDSVGSQARSTIRSLDRFRDQGSLSRGVRIAKGMGEVRVASYNPLCLPDDLDLEDPDNQIIATALSEKETAPKTRKVVVVSRDINMRVKCDALGLLTEDYQAEQVVESSDGLYTGRSEILVDEQEIDKFYNGEDIWVQKDDNKNKESICKAGMGRSMIIDQIKKAVQSKLENIDIGVQFVDFQIKRINYTRNVRQKVFQDISAERNKKATEYRTDGARLAREIIASAEAKVKKIYGESFSQDSDFYEFWRGLQVLEQSIDNSTKLIISDDSELFKLFKK